MIFLILKICFAFPTIGYYIGLLAKMIMIQGIASSMTVMSVAAFRKYRAYKIEPDYFEA